MEYVTLSNGIKMPILGYGVYQVTKDECERCVLDALKAGYRSLDTAQSYFNEEEVGAAIEKSGVPREDIFLTTKVWVEHYGYDACKQSVEESLKKLKTDYIDLMLLHQPFPIITAHGELWRICMRRACFAPSASPISILTGWWISRLLPASLRW